MGKAEIEAANEIYKTAREHADQELAELKEEIDGIRIESQAIGILKKIEYDTLHNEMLKYVVLLRLRESKEYKKGGMTWAQFCDEIVGEPKRTVDEKIADIRPVADKVWRVFAQMTGVTFSKIRYLGRSIGRDLAQIEDGALVFGDQRIPITPENKEDIEAAIDALKEAQAKELAEAKTAARVKDRQLAEKDRVIKKQEKELSRHEARIKERDYAPGEEEFIAQMEEIKLTISGLALRLEPDNMPQGEDMTALMSAAYLETCGHGWRILKGYYDDACERYGDEMDDGWQPTLPAPAEADAANEHPCIGCVDHKAKSNPKKGVLIPGYHGKCTRAGGLCESVKPD